jgi:hypothetical protein
MKLELTLTLDGRSKMTMLTWIPVEGCATDRPARIFIPFPLDQRV